MLNAVPGRLDTTTPRDLFQNLFRDFLAGEPFGMLAPPVAE
jgi:hypothetical protein